MRYQQDKSNTRAVLVLHEQQEGDTSDNNYFDNCTGENMCYIKKVTNSVGAVNAFACSRIVVHCNTASFLIKTTSCETTSILLNSLKPGGNKKIIHT